MCFFSKGKGHWRAGQCQSYGVSHVPVPQLHSRFQEAGRTNDRPRSGCPRVTTLEQDWHTMAEWRCDPLTSANKLIRSFCRNWIISYYCRFRHSFGIIHRRSAWCGQGFQKKKNVAYSSLRIKGIVHLKINICRKNGHPKAMMSSSDRFGEI